MGTLDRVGQHKRALIEALGVSLGIVSEACKSVGVSRQTYYNYLQADAAFEKAVKDIAEDAIDSVESALFKKVKGGNIVAIIFYLKCKAKQRGYVERMEIVQGDMDQMSDEEINSKIDKLLAETETDEPIEGTTGEGEPETGMDTIP